MKITTITMGAASALALGVLAWAPCAHADPVTIIGTPCSPQGATRTIDVAPYGRVICRANRLGELFWQADWTQVPGGSNEGMN